MVDLGRVGIVWTNELQIGNWNTGGQKSRLNDTDYMNAIEWMNWADFASVHPWIVGLTDDIRAKIAAMDI